MKTILFTLLLIFPLSITAQEKDSTFSHYGLIMDYTYSIGEVVGFKYRSTNSIAFFVKGGISSERYATRRSTGTSIDKFNTFGGVIGMEYMVLSRDNISFYTVFSGGLYVQSRGGLSIHHNREVKNYEYNIETGLGAEYFISKHLSIGGSQTVSLTYIKDNDFDYYDNPITTTQTRFLIVNAKLTLSFYF